MSVFEAASNCERRAHENLRAMRLYLAEVEMDLDGFELRLERFYADCHRFCGAPLHFIVPRTLEPLPGYPNPACRSAL